ncbi:hypothetical protein ACM0CK_17915, partial [Mycobacteroides abscessus subsp. abscessus]
RRRPALLGGATRVGNFDERQWGISVSAIKGKHKFFLNIEGMTETVLHVVDREKRRIDQWTAECCFC